MTKQEVRAAVLAKLGVGPEDTCWDIGTGTGSVAVELALQARSVWAVERDREAIQTAARNREKHGAWNLYLKEGSAPEVLEGLPKPDAVFVGVLCKPKDTDLCLGDRAGDTSVRPRMPAEARI